ncbi:MAG: hypothetical protein PF482_04515 [Desulfobacteraceae bacterium]|jgi:hypothetical protein|nr:hypothetical protein [Desulfobacteraceae bacterium]
MFTPRKKKYTVGKWFVGLTGAFLMVLLLGFGQPGMSGEQISVSIESSSIYADSYISDGRMTLRVSGPNDFFDELKSDAGSIYWNFAGAVDGGYRYDVFVKVPGVSEGDEGQLYREHGDFMVLDGHIQQPAEEEEGEDLGALETKSSCIARLAGGLIDWLVPSAHAADLTASGSGGGNVIFDDTDNTGSIDWIVDGSLTEFRIVDDVDDSSSGNNTTVFQILHSLNNENSFIIDALGDISLADGSVFIDRSANRLGIGTTTPAQEIHIVSSSPEIRLDGSTIWDIEAGDDLRFNLTDDGSGSTFNDFLTLENDESATYIKGVGIFEGNPEARLHVSSPGNDGTAKLLVKEENSTQANRFLFELDNYGSPLFKFTDSSRLNSFQFSLLDYGFVISRLDTGGAEFLIQNNGRIIMGPGGDHNFDLGTTGNLTIAGTLNEGSSRTIKENIVTADTHEILDKVCELPVMTWNYKKDIPDIRHLSPMAEDFYASFTLGEDNKHLSPKDMAGVALVAIKGLNEKLSEKDGHVATLEEKIKTLEEKIDRLESERATRLSSLEEKLRMLEASRNLALR